MARSPDGIRPQNETDSALYALIASRLERVPGTKLRGYALGTLGVDLGDNAIRKADKTAARIIDVPGSPLRPWLLVDYDRLDFFCSIVRLNLPDNQDLRALARITGVVHLARLASSRHVIATVIYERRSDQLRLKAQLNEAASILDWQQIEHQTHDPAVHTWRELARRAAEAEGLGL